jgi:hypothetical protein
MTFVDNSDPAPAVFCDVDRGPDHRGTDAYNAEWSRMLTALDDYLSRKGWEGKGYYYVQNEPQGPEDYDVAAFLAALTKQAAPNLRIAISEEPKPEIAQHPSAAGQSLRPVVGQPLASSTPTYAAHAAGARREVWWYFLYGDLPPHFNPITIDHPGIETRIAAWAAWKYRIRGFAYYSRHRLGRRPDQRPAPAGHRTRTATASSSTRRRTAS